MGFQTAYMLRQNHRRFSADCGGIEIMICAVILFGMQEAFITNRIPKNSDIYKVPFVVYFEVSAVAREEFRPIHHRKLARKPCPYYFLGWRSILTYFIVAPPGRDWQRNEGLLLLHSFLSLEMLVAFNWGSHFCSVVDSTNFAEVPFVSALVVVAFELLEPNLCLDYSIFFFCTEPVGV